eukprot:scaffold206332_cov33-Tisochrysis_lutea.AAC.3
MERDRTDGFLLMLASKLWCAIVARSCWTIASFLSSLSHTTRVYVSALGKWQVLNHPDSHSHIYPF